MTPLSANTVASYLAATMMTKTLSPTKLHNRFTHEPQGVLNGLQTDFLAIAREQMALAVRATRCPNAKPVNISTFSKSDFSILSLRGKNSKTEDHILGAGTKHVGGKSKSFTTSHCNCEITEIRP